MTHYMQSLSVIMIGFRILLFIYLCTMKFLTKCFVFERNKMTQHNNELVFLRKLHEMPASILHYLTKKFLKIL